MPLNRACSLDALRENIAAEIEAGRNRDQAVAVAHATLREACRDANQPVPSAKEIGAVAREFRRKGGHSREYLEEALNEAKKLLPHRTYAALYQAARSRAGGRVSARSRATSIEKALAFGPSALFSHELEDAVDRARLMLANDLRVERHVSLATMMIPRLEFEMLQRSGRILGTIAKADRSDDPGVMIAFRLPPNTAKAIAISNGEPAERLHVTLAYLGRMSAIGADGLERATAALRSMSCCPPFKGSISGIARFAATESSDDLDVVYASVDVPGLSEFRYRLVNELECRGIPIARNHDFTPHVTLAYVSPDAPQPRLTEVMRLRDVFFDSIVLSVNDADTVFKLGELPPLPSAPSPEAFAMAVAKGERFDSPSVHGEVAEVGAHTLTLAFGDDRVEVAKNDDAPFDVGDMVSVSAFGIEPSSAVESTPVEVARTVAKGITDLVERAMPIDFIGPSSPRVVFVAGAPSDLEYARQEAVVGVDGLTFVDRYLAPLCLTKSQVALGFAVPIRPEPPVANPHTAPPDQVVPDDQLKRWAWWLEKNLARWPGVPVIALGKVAKTALGERSAIALPHPSVVRRFDSGEVHRKLRAFAKSLDGDLGIRHHQIDPTDAPSSGVLVGKVADAIGELRTAGQILVRISKADGAKQIVYGVVLDPYQVDAHEDWIPPSEIESTAHGFLKKSRVIGVEHRRAAKAVIVESSIIHYPSEKDYKLAMQNSPHKAYEMPYGNDTIHSGAWIAGVELGNEEWAAYQRGELGAFSIGGFSFKTKVPAAAMPKVEFVKLSQVP